MNSKDVKKGMLVLIVQDSTHKDQFGIVGERHIESEYNDDCWIHFLSGDKAPYGPYEYEPVTEEFLNARIEELEHVKNILKKTEE